MAEVQATTKRMFVPKFDKVCDVNVTDETLMREQYHAIDESAYLAGLAKSSGNPFKKESGKKAEKTEDTDPADDTNSTGTGEGTGDTNSTGNGDGTGEATTKPKASKAAGK